METQPNFQENHDNNEIQNPEIQDNNKDLGQAQEMGEIALDSLKNEIIPADDSNDETNPAVGVLANKNNYSVTEAAISGEEIAAFSVGMNAIEKRFGEESAAHISNELLKIDSIRNETLDALEQRDELKPELRSMARGLSTRGINAYNLTPDEVGRVYNYATNATPEIERAKIDRIFDAFHRHINSPSGRRDGLEPAFYNLEEAERKTELLDRYRDWDRGQLDLSRGFDVEATYERLIKSGEYEEGNWLLRDVLENDDIEDLLDRGLIEEDDLFIYGPFTSNDIKDIELFNSNTWTDVTGWRSNLTRKKKKVELKNADGEVIKDADGKAKTTTIEVDRVGATLASIIGDTVSPNISDIECDLTYDYIANEILQNRRLKSKDLLMASSAIALEVLDMDPPEDKEKRESYNSAKKTCSWIGYYAAEALGYRKSELKERYGNTRPTDQKFFEEIASTSEQLTEERAEYLDKYFKQTFTKMDEHLHEILNRLVEINEDNPMAGEEWD